MIRQKNGKKESYIISVKLIAIVIGLLIKNVCIVVNNLLQEEKPRDIALIVAQQKT